jgi:hypothetical protein
MYVGSSNRVTRLLANTFRQTDRNRSLVMLLRDLSLRVSAEDKGKISRLLEGVSCVA